MKPKCPNCNSEDLDEGLDGKILCHGKNEDGTTCGKVYYLIATWTVPNMDKDIRP